MSTSSNAPLIIKLGGEVIASAGLSILASDIAAIVASGGSTNAGVIDDLAGCADVADELDAWLHVDGAYGGPAALAEGRHGITGLDLVDSFVLDPHKVGFVPRARLRPAPSPPSRSSFVFPYSGSLP